MDERWPFSGDSKIEKATVLSYHHHHHRFVNVCNCACLCNIMIIIAWKPHAVCKIRPSSKAVAATDASLKYSLFFSASHAKFIIHASRYYQQKAESHDLCRMRFSFLSSPLSPCVCALRARSWCQVKKNPQIRLIMIMWCLPFIYHTFIFSCMFPYLAKKKFSFSFLLRARCPQMEYAKSRIIYISNILRNHICIFTLASLPSHFSVIVKWQIVRRKSWGFSFVFFFLAEF